MTTRIIKIVIDSKGAKKGGKDVERALGGVEKGSKSAGGALTSVKGALIATAAILAVKKVIELGDAWSSLQGQLRLVTGSSAELETTTKALFEISQRTRQSLQGTADLYVRLGRSTDFTNDRILQLTETIGQTIALSRASPEAAKAALFQLGQGFAAGALRGEELNSVLEQTPELAKAISDGLGVTLGQLRILGAQGKLTAEAVAEGLEASAEGVNEEFGTIPLTVGDAVTRVGNSMQVFVGTLDAAFQATSTLAAGVNKVSEVIQGLNVLLGDDKGFGAEAGRVGKQVDAAKTLVTEIERLIELDKKRNPNGSIIQDNLLRELDSAAEKLRTLSALQLDLIANGGLTNAEKELKDLEDLRGSIALTIQKTTALFAISSADNKLAKAFEDTEKQIAAVQKRLSQGKIDPAEAAELEELLRATFADAEGRNVDAFAKTFEDGVDKAKAELIKLNDFIEREVIDDDVAESIRIKLQKIISPDAETRQEVADKFADTFQTAAEAAEEKITLLDEFVAENLIDTDTALKIRARLEAIVAKELVVKVKADVEALQSAEDKIQDIQDRIAAFNEGGKDALSATKSFQEARDIIEELGDEATVSVFELAKLIETEKQLGVVLGETVDDFESAGDAAEDFFRRARENSQDILADFFAGGFDSIDDFERAFADMLLNLASQALAAEIFGAIFGKEGGDGGLIGAAGSFLGDFFGGNAQGGDVKKGDFGVVGEEGPEIFQAPTAGRITPNGASVAQPTQVNVGGPTIINTIDSADITGAFNGGEGDKVLLNRISTKRNAFRKALGV